MRIDQIISDYLVGKTLISVEYRNYDDLEYYKSIGVTPAILPSKIKSVSFYGDDDVIVEMVLENGTIANAYDTEEITVEE